MTKTISILLIIFCTLSIHGQTDNLDKKLLVKYSKKELKKLKSENPDEYDFEKYCVNNAFYIAPSSPEKIQLHADSYGNLKIDNVEKVNFFELKIELKQKKNQVFIINNTTTVLIVKSKDQILKEFNK